jgi:hypothetical protein
MCSRRRGPLWRRRSCRLREVKLCGSLPCNGDPSALAGELVDSAALAVLLDAAELDRLGQRGRRLVEAQPCRDGYIREPEPVYAAAVRLQHDRKTAA